ncbi:type II secretion system protein GspE [Lonsdalea populi]|uniref:Type II secretion system protein GspE n=1 Tax=Lonsdalea populi TaxID=1172565 RepID=A0A3N0UR24_9GAMM|nr:MULTISPECIES: type II secretion system protein GspE [Lonsdalea]RAT13724.1 type II secretion system protein GspE [Lonsdalea quercina]RAT25492.1 type II secretion system protein GspE [Lonsdalea populi]RAT32018.1 type II secretion system protein GspE [Lonsdalea populi]RAT42869.1 type II secretion system protein GspE [Lonsdalea populi]RAT51381.1 type II secretion system protein GspE [Lonsdalea populi]
MTPQILSDELSVLCQRYHALLLAIDEQSITVAVGGTPSAEMLTALKFASNRRVVIEKWPAARLEKQLVPPQSAMEKTSTYQPTSEVEVQEDIPVVRFINQTLNSAIQRRASDIHFEPMTMHCRIRLRIDGVLQEVPSAPDELTPRLIARLKIMGKLDIAERRLPQDGQFTLQLDQERYSLRIATLPIHTGEKVVLRVLQTQQQALTLDTLGLSTRALRLFKQVLRLPQGMILVTGPTGSGKTFTLYSAIRWLNSTSRNICSVEDPVEIPLEGINQTAVNAKSRLDFSRVLRALLRQDPDVIMIGEIRDSETADIAVKAAQTGHLVLSTLHTNSASETITRLRHLGVPGYLLASALKLIIAQRLVRKLCPHCREPVPSKPVSPHSSWSGPLRQWRPQGCNHCFSGYYGRVAIYDLLAFSPELQQTLSDDGKISCENPHDQNFHLNSLFNAGLTLVNEGITSLDEVFRVVGDGMEEED